MNPLDKLPAKQIRQMRDDMDPATPGDFESLIGETLVSVDWATPYGGVVLETSSEILVLDTFRSESATRVVLECPLPTTIQSWHDSVTGDGETDTHQIVIHTSRGAVVLEGESVGGFYGVLWRGAVGEPLVELPSEPSPERALLARAATFLEDYDSPVKAFQSELAGDRGRLAREIRVFLGSDRSDMS